jgi:hypothetical protein
MFELILISGTPIIKRAKVLSYNQAIPSLPIPQRLCVSFHSTA